MSSSRFPCDSLAQVNESTDNPVLIKHSHTIAIWRAIILDHAKLAVNRPKHEKDDKHVMRIPESLVVVASRLFH
jgi:hypothetical protein